MIVQRKVQSGLRVIISKQKLTGIMINIIFLTEFCNWSKPVFYYYCILITKFGYPPNLNVKIRLVSLEKCKRKRAKEEKKTGEVNAVQFKNHLPLIQICMANIKNMTFYYIAEDKIIILNLKHQLRNI